MNQLIHCVNCHAVFLKTPYDQGQEYEFHSLRPPERFPATDRDDFQDFLKDHRGHRLEDLRIIEDSLVSEKRYSEAVKVSYFKATNGKEIYVIRKSRQSIEEPLTYQIIRGDYSLRCTGIDIQSDEIVKQLAREFEDAPFPPGQIEAFLKLFQHIAETIDVKRLERIPEESPHPLEVYYKIDDFSLIYLMRNCRHIFEGKEYSEIESFIHRHREDGVLLLKGTHHIEITEKVQPLREAMPAQIPMGKKKAAEKT